MTIKEEKRELRRALKRRLAERDPNRKKKADRAICQSVVESARFKSAQSVFCFVSLPQEIDTRLILQETLKRGKTLIVPRVVGDGLMDLVPVDDLDALEPHAMGILEPPREAPAVSKDAIDLAIIPCLSASRRGQRLGRGGGFYDRFLADYTGETLLVVYEDMLMDDVPMEPWDQTLPFVVTERGIYSR